MSGIAPSSNRPFFLQDQHAVRREDGSVDHAASAKADFKQAGRDLLNVAKLDHFDWVFDNAGRDIGAQLLAFSMFAGVGFIGVGLWELSDVVLNPLVKAPTNFLQGVYHSARAVFE